MADIIGGAIKTAGSIIKTPLVFLGKAVNAVTNTIGFTDQSNNYSANIDFFKLYNLHKYSTDTGYDTDPGDVPSFIPLYLTTTVQNSGIGGQKGGAQLGQLNDEETLKLTFILPWDIHEIKDDVQVSFSKKYGNGITGSLAQAVGQQANGIANAISGFGGDLMQAGIDTFLINYNSSELKKDISFNFVLPLYSSHMISYANGVQNDSYVTEEWAQNIRDALGNLQGLVYPKTIAALVPPLMKVRLGSLYRGFKGFVNHVTLNESDVYITSGNVLWPSIIRGTISLTNVFNYFWSNSNTGTNYTDLGMAEFNLSANPSLLFGIYSAEGGTGVNGGAKAEDKTNYRLGNDSSGVKVRFNYGSWLESQYLDHTKNFSLTQGLVDQKYITTSDKIDAVTMKNAKKSQEEFTEKIENSSKSFYDAHEVTNYLKDNGVGDEEITDYNSLAQSATNNTLAYIYNDNLGFIGMGVDGNENFLSDSSTLSKKVVDILNSDTILVEESGVIKSIDNPYKITNAGSYSRVISKLLNTSGQLSNLKLASKICDSTLNDFNNNASILGDNFDLSSNIIQSVSKDIDIDSALSNYVDSDNIISNIKKISNYKEFTNTIYAATLYSKQYYMMANNLNSNISANDSIYSDKSNAPYFPLSTLYNSSLILNGTEFYSYLSFYTELWSILNDQVDLLNDNGDINTSIKSIVEKIYANTQLLKNDSMSNINSKLYDIVNSIIGSLV